MKKLYKILLPLTLAATMIFATAAIGSAAKVPCVGSTGVSICIPSGSCGSTLDSLLKEYCSEGCCGDIREILNRFGCSSPICQGNENNVVTESPNTVITIPENGSNEADHNSSEQTQPQAAAPESEGYALNEYELKVVTLINNIRKEHGFSQLSVNNELSRVARIKALDMKENRYFDHNSPTYGSPFEMMRSFGISYNTAGENIAAGYASPEAVVNGWMNSDGHRKNILNASFKEIGMGYVSEGHYWSQMFIG